MSTPAQVSGDKDESPLFCAIGSPSSNLSDEELRTTINSFLKTLGPREDVLLLPPDFTRFHSQSGKLTQMICSHYNFIEKDTVAADTTADDDTKPRPTKEAKTSEDKKSASADLDSDSAATTTSSSTPHIEILPALGTHAPMTPEEIRKMFGPELAAKACPSPFLVHNWKQDVVTIGEAPATMVQAATHGMVDKPWPAQLNQKVWSKRICLHDPTKQPHRSLVLSIGQVVPHEVMGMANFNKNLFVGTGGVEAINLSHFIGAVHGMERMMGKKDNPLRSILNYASEKYLETELDLWYILTVVSPDPETGTLCLRGLFIGRDIQCYSKACDLSLQVNFTILDRPVKRMVTYLDPEEFHSTWLGNKAIYRTRMVMADDGELIILAPGVSRFGEDDQVDKLIRKYGYKGTPAAMKAMEGNEELKDSLSAVAHLIHGSSEGRFKITYCPGHLNRSEIEGVGFEYGDLDEMSRKYDVTTLRDGWQKDDQGEFFFIGNPALGLWTVETKVTANAS